jgi:uncharacterized protein YraI
MASGGTTYIPIFMTIPLGIQVILRLLLQNLRGCNVGITDGRDFFKLAVGMASDGIIYVPSCMEIGAGVQAILRFCLNILRGCNVSITDGREI